jgi:hypothetical protein
VAKPELVIKHVYGWSEGYRLALRPGFCLFGNRTGLEWLAARVASIAQGIDEDAAYLPDNPDAVVDVGEIGPWNRKLSDELHLTLGSYADRRRRRALAALNVTPESQLTGPPTEQWSRLLAEMAEWVEGRTAGLVLSEADRGQLAASFDELVVAASAAAARIRATCGN